jgi:hypothetical protein
MIILPGLIPMIILAVVVVTGAGLVGYGVGYMDGRKKRKGNGDKD